MVYGTYESLNDVPLLPIFPMYLWPDNLDFRFGVITLLNLFFFFFRFLTEAVPKRILDLMNVEKLTRENVASHLQARSIIISQNFLPPLWI